MRVQGVERWAATPERVARVILRTVQAAHPRARYRVRIRESPAAGFLAVIPHSALDWLMVRFTGGRIPPETTTGSSVGLP